MQSCARIARPVVAAACLLLASGAGWAKPTKLQLVCIGTETIETIRGDVVEPVQQGEFRVEYRIDLARGLIESTRAGQATAINVTTDELNFGSATNFNPEFKDSLSSNGFGTGTSATGIRIDRKTGRYFAMATRKRVTSDLSEDGSQAFEVVVTTIRTRQGRCSDGKGSSF